MKFRIYLLTLIQSAILCVTKTLAAEIPAEHLGADKWVTLKTENGYYFYAIEEGSQIKLGQTKTAPNSQNYAAYCWMIEGNASEGYTFRCLKYEKADGSETPESERRYISNPSTLATANYEVLLSNTPRRYLYTEKHQLQLKANTNLYLAFYSQNYHTIRLHNSADYVGSRMIIGGINDWSVAAVVYGTETQDGNGLPQGTYLPSGGIISNGTSYAHGSSLYLNDESLSQLSISRIQGLTKKQRAPFTSSAINLASASIPIPAPRFPPSRLITSWNRRQLAHPPIVRIIHLDTSDIITNSIIMENKGRSDQDYIDLEDEVM